MPTCEKVIPRSFVSKFNASQYEWTFKNDSKLFFFPEGYEKDKEYNRWNGLEVNFILMDQVEEMQVMAFEKALERVGSYFIIGATQPPPLIIITVNPTPTWVKALVYDRWMNKTLPTDWIYIPSKITDNPHVPLSFKQSLLELKKVNPIKYKRFVEGDWDIQDNIEGAFYKDFDYEKQVGTTAEDLNVYYDPGLPLHVSFDFNVNPYMTLIVCQIDIDNDEVLEDGQPRRKRLNIIQEFCMVSPNNTTSATCKAFARVYSEHVGGVFIHGDPAGKHEDTRSEKGYNDYTIIKKELVRFHPRIKVATSAPSVVMRGSFINTILRNQPYKEDSKTVGYKGISIHIDEDCTNMIKDFTNQLEDADGKKLKSKKTDPLTKVRSEEYGHTGDAADYLICEVFKKEYRLYQRGGGEEMTEYHIPATSSKKF